MTFKNRKSIIRKLRKQNVKMRNELKDMNDDLTKIIEKVSMIGPRKKKQSIKDYHFG